MVTDVVTGRLGKIAPQLRAVLSDAAALENDRLVPHTAAVSQLASADDVIAGPLAKPISAGTVRTLAPTSAGPYAWWARPDVLPG